MLQNRTHWLVCTNQASCAHQLCPFRDYCTWSCRLTVTMTCVACLCQSSVTRIILIWPTRPKQHLSLTTVHLSLKWHVAVPSQNNSNYLGEKVRIPHFRKTEKMWWRGHLVATGSNGPTSAHLKLGRLWHLLRLPSLTTQSVPKHCHQWHGGMAKGRM